MAKNTKIIEFVGLPASGKTTIIDEILKNNFFNEDEIIIWNDITKEIKKNGLFRIIKSLSIKKIFLYAKLFKSFSYSFNKKIELFKVSLKIEIVYKYCKKYTNYKYILIDHGILQQFISSNNGYKIEEKALVNLEKILEKSYIDKCFFCKIDVDLAHKRMIKRKRNDGRIDIEKDRLKQRKMLENENKSFKILEDILQQQKYFKVFFMETEKIDINNIYEKIIC